MSSLKYALTLFLVFFFFSYTNIQIVYNSKINHKNLQKLVSADKKYDLKVKYEKLINFSHNYCKIKN
jgi:hypothetical protein